jgi:membrane-associated protein
VLTAAGLSASAPAGLVLGSATTWLQHHLQELNLGLVYVVVGALVFLEVGIVIGFFVPGEIAAVLGGVISSRHGGASVAVMVVVVAGAAVAGNFSGYELGKLLGPGLLSHRPLEGRKEVDRAQRLVSRRGGPAVLIARWIAVVRALVPGVAGLSGMDRRIFGIFSVAGGIGWATMWVLVGFAAGLSYTKILNVAGRWSLVVLGGVVVLLVGAWVVHRVLRRRRRRSAAEPSG